MSEAPQTVSVRIRDLVDISDSELSLGELAARLEVAGLMTKQQLSTLCDSLDLPVPVSANDVMRKLLESGSLSQYQAQKVIAAQAEQLRLGDYVIVRPIGAGGMGEVLLAVHQRMKREVALKLLPGEFASQATAVKRFQREVEVAARLTHPNIVTAYDAGEQNGVHYLVMEYVDGDDLASIVRQHGPLSIENAIRCVVQAGAGIGYAHEAGIIHRDIKPGNLLVGPDGVVKVLDMGLASWRAAQSRSTESDLSLSGTLMGTVDYLAPEQAVNAKSADQRSDIYSVGCTLFSLIQGRPIHERATVVEKLLAHREADPPDLVATVDARSERLNRTFQKMIACKPDDRFATIAEAVATLRDCVFSPEADMTIDLPIPESNIQPRLAATTPTHSMKAERSLQATDVETRVAASAEVKRPMSSVPRSIIAVAVLGSLLLGAAGITALRRRNPNGNLLDDAAKVPVVASTPVVETTSIADGLTVAQNGSANFTSINEALRNIGRGERILVLDNDTYVEQIAIDDPVQHWGITLEAADGATIKLKPNANFAIKIEAVERVSVVGFHFAATDAVSPFATSLVRIEGNAAGAVCDDLIMESQSLVNGIGIFNNTPEPDADPIIVKNCRLSVGGSGVVLTGLPNLPVGKIRIENNRLSATKGINLELSVQEVHLTGNVITNCSMAGIELRSLCDGAKGILIANNSIFNCAVAVRIWDQPPPTLPDLEFAYESDQVTLVNNVLLNSQLPDIVVIKHRPPHQQPTPIDSSFLLSLWKFSGNWRDPSAIGSPGALPIAEQDQNLKGDHFISIRPTDEDFLRPMPDSPLATQGFDHVGLPAYAGAVPPRRAETWDWKRTWDAWLAERKLPK